MNGIESREESSVSTGPNNGPIMGTCNEISNEVTCTVLESYFNLVIVIRSGLVEFRVRTLVVVMHVLVLLINPEGTLMKSGQSAQNEFVKSNRGRVSISRSNVMNRCTCATRGREKQKRNDEEWERGDVVPFTPSNIGIHKSTVIVVVRIHARQTFLPVGKLEDRRDDFRALDFFLDAETRSFEKGKRFDAVQRGLDARWSTA